MRRRFFISGHGDDGYPGTLARPWKTLKRAEAESLLPGDSLFLAGGQTFAGSLTVRGNGSKELFTITSYGEGAACIDAGDRAALRFVEVINTMVSDLRIIGSGPKTNSGHGVHFSLGPQPHPRAAIAVSDLEISGFGLDGLLVDCAGKSGARILRIERVHSHHHGRTGIQVAGHFDQHSDAYAHENLFISHCHVHDVSGIAGAEQHSGSGIVASDVHGGLIEFCRAHDNGALNTAATNGPIGIWAWDSRDLVIENCESFRNRTASVTDGGGFGLDGGAVNCRLRKNLSYENDGAGYCLSQFKYARPFRGNVVESNESRNDGRRNHYGAIHLWCAEPGGVSDTLVQKNKIVVGRAVFGRARGVRIQGITRGMRFRENEFKGDEPIFLLDAESGQEDLFWDPTALNGQIY